MIEEDFDVFFSDFAADATWGETAGKVIIDAPEDIIVDGMVISPATVIRFPSSQWQGIKEGDKIKVGQKTFRLTQSPRRENDGAISFSEVKQCL